MSVAGSQAQGPPLIDRYSSHDEAGRQGPLGNKAPSAPDRCGSARWVRRPERLRPRARGHPRPEWSGRQGVRAADRRGSGRCLGSRSGSLWKRSTRGGSYVSPAPLFGAGIAPSETVSAVASPEVAEATQASGPATDANRGGAASGIPATGAPSAGLSSADVPSADGSSSNSLVAWLVPLAVVLLVLSPTLVIGAWMAREARNRGPRADQ